MASTPSKANQPKASETSKNTNEPEVSESSRNPNKLQAFESSKSTTKPNAAESSVRAPSSVSSSTSKSKTTASSKNIIPSVSVPTKAPKLPPASKPRVKKVRFLGLSSDSVPSSRPQLSAVDTQPSVGRQSSSSRLLSVIDTQASAGRQSSSSRRLSAVDARVPPSHQASPSRPLSNVDLPAPASSLPSNRASTTKRPPPSSGLSTSGHQSSSVKHADSSSNTDHKASSSSSSGTQIAANKTARSKPPGAPDSPPEEAYQSLVYADMSKQQYVPNPATKSPSTNPSTSTEVAVKPRQRPFVPYKVIGKSGMLLEWYSVKAMTVMMVDKIIRRFCNEVNWDWFEDNLSKFTKYERPLTHLEHYGGITAVYQLWCREQDRASPMLFFDGNDGALRWGQQFVYLLVVRFMGDPRHLTREGQERIRKLAENVANGGDILERTKLWCKANGLVYPGGTGRTEERLELIKRSLGSAYGKHVGVG